MQSLSTFGIERELESLALEVAAASGIYTRQKGFNPLCDEWVAAQQGTQKEHLARACEAGLQSTIPGVAERADRILQILNAPEPSALTPA